MSNTILIPYTGPVPGADTNTYTLLDTRPKLGVQAIPAYDMSRYVVSFKNSHPGTMKVYASSDGTPPTNQIFEVYVFPSIPQRTNDFEVPIIQHTDLLVQWVNTGTAQSPWYVGQCLAADATAKFTIGYEDPLNLVNGSMAHPTAPTLGNPIQIGPEGQLIATMQWPATGSPAGTFSLLSLYPDGVWRAVPGASTEFTQPTGAATAGNFVAYWRELQPFRRVRIAYTSTGGGAGNTGLAIQTVAR